MTDSKVSRDDFNRAMTTLGLDHTDRGLHLISVEIEAGLITANFTSVTKVGTLDDTRKPAPVYREHNDPDAVEPGLYRVHWKSGGSSLAAVGHDHSGRQWLAPTNWIITPATFGPCFDWSGVDRVDRINPDHNATVHLSPVAEEFIRTVRT